jgi:hypothetical protein
MVAKIWRLLNEQVNHLKRDSGARLTRMQDDTLNERFETEPSVIAAGI